MFGAAQKYFHEADSYWMKEELVKRDFSVGEKKGLKAGI